MGSPWWLVGVLLGVSAVARAGKARPPAEAEAGVGVEGSIVGGSDGRTVEYEHREPERLPGPVSAYLEHHIPRWQFVPPELDGQPVQLRNRMYIYVVARPSADGGMRLDLAGASFIPIDQDAGYEVTGKKLGPPRYPLQANALGVGATVYLAVRVGRKGGVLDVAAEQVNLHFLPEDDRDQWERLFVRNALDAARKWTFNVPVHGEVAAHGDWSLRVPVRYVGWSTPLQYG